jgi:hypothetical protein
VVGELRAKTKLSRLRLQYRRQRHIERKGMQTISTPLQNLERGEGEAFSGSIHDETPSLEEVSPAVTARPSPIRTVLAARNDGYN